MFNKGVKLFYLDFQGKKSYKTRFSSKEHIWKYWIAKQNALILNKKKHEGPGLLYWDSYQKPFLLTQRTKLKCSDIYVWSFKHYPVSMRVWITGCLWGILRSCQARRLHMWQGLEFIYIKVYLINRKISLCINIYYC